MPKISWVEIVVTTVYLLNCCMTEGIHMVTPHEKYFGVKVDLSHLTVFSNITFLHVLDEKHKKQDPKS